MGDVKTTAQQWQRVKTILADALECPSLEDRNAYLNSSCGGDTTLMREVEALLALSSQNLDDLADNAPGTFANGESMQPSGQRIGAYEIVRELGRGGMGAVYLAKRADGKFEKEVAIKLLKRGTDTDEILRRFHAEQRILAQLDHPNIARLLDAGTTDNGLPYFVLEYVAGLSITRYVRDNQLPIAARLQLFLKVCAAVHFAHQHRVVHRDLKPGNIFVRQDGEPKLLDFGIAKLLASGNNAIELTLTAERRFTAICASPEQARGETVTPASDVYALGALLYEILTDRTPYRFSTPHPSQAEVAQVIAEREPVRPSLNNRDNQVRRQLRGDLDKIVLMALRKEPTRRYSSAAALAEDIRRHLDGSPIRAQPNTFAYVSRRFVARQKYRVAALVMLATLGIALSVVLISYRAELRRHASAIADKSIAVLPFENLSDDKGNSFFADGVQDEILTDLAKLKELKVISRTSVMQYKNTGARDLREIARHLGVGHVLEGTVQRAGNHIRISAQLIDARTDSHLWAESYERDLADVFAIQNEIAKSIAAQLQAKISPDEKTAIEQKPTADLVAYDLYLRANALRHEMATSKDWEADTRRAVDLLDQAISRDPNFALAYCMLCKLNFTLYAWVDKTPARLALVETALKNAIRIAPESGDTYLVRGRWYMHDMDWEHGLDAVMRAAKLLPGSVDVLMDAASLESRLGRWSDATRDLEKAKELDPANPNIPNGLTDLYASLHDYLRSDQIADAAIAKFPSGPGYFQISKVTNALDRGDVKAARVALAAIRPGWDPSGLTSTTRVAVAIADRNYPEATHLIATTRRENLIEFSAVDLGFFEALVAQEQGDVAKAKTILVSMREKAEAHLRNLPNDIPLLSRLARIDAYLGRNSDALHEIARASELARDAVGRPGVMTIYAEVYLRAGQRDKALQLLSELAKNANGPSYGDLLGPRWDSLRTDPRFKTIVTDSVHPIKI
jgi:serine/threonine protein kinase